jgi:hypothetical protein
MPSLPFSGDSAHHRYQQSLSDRQLKMLTKLEEACRPVLFALTDFKF